LQMLCEALQVADPSAIAVPTLQIETRDALGWRQRQVPCYGFAPWKLASSDHAADASRRSRPATARPAWIAGAEVFMKTAARLLIEG